MGTDWGAEGQEDGEGQEEEPSEGQEEESGEGQEEESGEDDLIVAPDGNFRRLAPVRDLTLREGDRYVHVHVGTAQQLKWQTALALALRRQHIAAQESAPTPGYGAVRKQTMGREWAALRRLSQVQVGRELMHQWCQAHGLECGLDPNACHPTIGQGFALRRAKSYYKTFCSQVYGGLLWQKFFVALGEVWGDDYLSSRLSFSLEFRTAGQNRNPHRTQQQQLAAVSWK